MYIHYNTSPTALQITNISFPQKNVGNCTTQSISDIFYTALFAITLSISPNSSASCADI